MEGNNHTTGIYQSQNDLLTRKQAAEYVGYSVSRIGDFINSGKLPHIERGRRHYVRRKDLDALFKPAVVPEEERTREIARTIATEEPASLLRGGGAAC